MANQRKESKKQVGGYIDETLLAEIENTGMDKTEFLEWATVRGLMLRKRITPGKVLELAQQDRIKESTINNLRQEGLLK